MLGFSKVNPFTVVAPHSERELSYNFSLHYWGEWGWGVGGGEGCNENRSIFQLEVVTSAWHDFAADGILIEFCECKYNSKYEYMWMGYT